MPHCNKCFELHPYCDWDKENNCCKKCLSKLQTKLEAFL